MRVDEHRRRLHDRRHADRVHHIAEEHQERAAERPHALVQAHAVDGGAHRVLAHAEVDVAAGVFAGCEDTVALEVGLGRGREVGRAADQGGQFRRDGV